MSRKRSLTGPLLILPLSILVALVVAEFAVKAFMPLRLVGPPVTEFDPTYGHRHRANFSGRQVTPEYTWHFSFNSLGHRGPEPEANGQPILFLGDSFTVGLGVDDGEEFPRLVRDGLIRDGMLNVSVINAGTGNSGQGRWLKLLRNEGDTIRPCMIVLQVLENDFSDNGRENLFRLSPEGELIEQPIGSPSLGRRIQQFVETIPGISATYLFALLRQAYHSRTVGASGEAVESASPEQRASRVAQEDGLTYRLLEEVGSTIADHGWSAVAIVVDLPPDRLDRVIGILQRFGIRAEAIPGKEVRPDLYYEIDGHWNRAGHVHAAERVLHMLREGPPLECGDQAR